MAFVNDRQFVLRDLVALRQIRIEIVLARKHAALGDLGVDRQAELDRVFESGLVQHRQYARHAERDASGLSVRLRAVRSGSAGKDLGLRSERAKALEDISAERSVGKEPGH